MQGQILGNRYELVEKIGGGGMAIVYKAKCKLLNRYVAVKILRPEFTNDEEFVKRFLVEAQSAASLSHPNIVSIYDVGHENSMHYIVMEFINGITLKEYIDSKKSLPWKDAVNITIQICSAIEHAHRHNIVHRDIKPHNIMITEDGIAKVTDFGIARAVSSSTITMVGSTIGSVHYFSPEQARGGYIGEKSDIYSIGIALYEMVTGKLPFDGETPVAVALKHLQEDAVPPAEVNPSVPKGLNDIIMKAIKKEQDSRYQSATEMLQDLQKVIKDPNGSFVREETTDSSPTRRIKAINEENLKEREDIAMKGSANTGKKKNDKKTVWFAVATSAVVIITFLVMMFLVSSPFGKKAPNFEVGDYKGRNFNEVKNELAASNIDAKISSRKNDDEFKKDEIISQEIDPGRTLKPGGYINFVVSDGPKIVKVPDVSKMEYRAALTKLETYDLTGKVEDEFHPTIAEGLVTRTDPPAETEIKANSTIIVYKSKGPEIKETKVPKVIGMTRTEAMNAITQAGLKIGEIKPEDNSIITGKVISQNPVEGTVVKEDTAVNIVFETPAPSPTPSGQRVMKTQSVELKDPQKYGNKIKLKVDIIPSDTNKMEVYLDKTVDKKDFPLTLSIPVPINGKTQILVYLDNILYQTSTLSQ